MKDSLWYLLNFGISKIQTNILEHKIILEIIELRCHILQRRKNPGRISNLLNITLQIRGRQGSRTQVL